MYRKQFQLIAETIRDIPDYDVRRDVAERLATVLAPTNRQFDRQRFIDVATGVRPR